jgi:hypothetical protein
MPTAEVTSMATELFCQFWHWSLSIHRIEDKAVSKPGGKATLFSPCLTNKVKHIIESFKAINRA